MVLRVIAVAMLVHLDASAVSERRKAASSGRVGPAGASCIAVADLTRGDPCEASSGVLDPQTSLQTSDEENMRSLENCVAV